MTPTSQRLAERIAQLIAQRRPFVQATVVRAQCPTSTRPGDSAIVHPDGTIEGFVGGQCAEGSVRSAALDVHERGEATLLRILPDEAHEFPDTPGARTTINPCLSGGAIEVYLEPKIPPARVSVVGNTPIADALASLGAPLGFAIERPALGEEADAATGATAVIIASHGRGEEAAIRAALGAGVGFIGLVASRTRGDAVIGSLALGEEERQRVTSPVGIDIGARTAEEIAVSILAELVRAVRVGGLTAPADPMPDAGDRAGADTRPATAIDPVCGMTVVVDDDTPHLGHDGVDHWYCNPGCRSRHAEELGLAS